MFHSRWRNVPIVATKRAVLEAKEEFYEQLKAVIDNSQGTQARHNHRLG